VPKVKCKDKSNSFGWFRGKIDADLIERLADLPYRMNPSPRQTVRATVLLERRSLKALLSLLKPSVILSIEEITPAGWTRRVLTGKGR
jgi:hypothetical protein